MLIYFDINLDETKKIDLEISKSDIYFGVGGLAIIHDPCRECLKCSAIRFDDNCS